MPIPMEGEQKPTPWAFGQAHFLGGRACPALGEPIPQVQAPARGPHSGSETEEKTHKLLLKRDTCGKQPVGAQRKRHSSFVRYQERLYQESEP